MSPYRCSRQATPAHPLWETQALTMKRSTLRIFTVLVLASSVSISAEEDRLIVVRQGQLKAATAVTERWEAGDGCLVSMRESFERKATETDKPIAGLIADLRQRDLLRDTLIVWGGEFGRQANPDNNGGRGHNSKGYTMWMAGGGVKGGIRYGSTDELGRQAVDGAMGTHGISRRLFDSNKRKPIRSCPWRCTSCESGM